MANEKIGVVGAGLMGAEIALVYALAGHHVLLSDTGEANLAAAIGGNFDRRWTAGSPAEGIVKHDIPAIYCEFTRGLEVEPSAALYNERGLAFA